MTGGWPTASSSPPSLAAAQSTGARLLLAEVDHEPLPSSTVMEQLASELERLDDEVHELLLAVALGFDLSLPVPASLLGSTEGIDILMAKARAAGLLLPDGSLLPLVRRTLLETTPRYRLRMLQRTLVDAFTAEGMSLDHIARDLAQSGLEDDRVALTLERAADAALAADPALAATLYDEAISAGSDEAGTAARRAQAAWASGDLDGAGRIVDGLLASGDPPDLHRAVDVDAAVWAGRGMLAHGAELYRWLGPAAVGPSGPLAVVTLIGVGDREGAEQMATAAAPGGSPTLLTVAKTLVSEGVRDSVEARVSHALPTLVRSSDLMTASGLTVPMPDTPAALAALVALHAGDLDAADASLTAALAGDQGGAGARPRLLLLSAWTAMQRDRLDLAHAAMEEAALGESQLAPRDELVLCGLEVGLARRADDAPALVRAWRKASERILHVPVDLFSLMPLGELLVAATRLQDARRLEVHLTEAWSLLNRLGDPPLWSIPLRWYAVQAAIIAERPSDLAPHAAALVRASADNRLASVLANAGRTWISVLAGDFAVPPVEAAARGLASVGRRWDGSRLAAHAAARSTESKHVTRLLACARELHPTDSVAAGRPAAGTSPVPPSAGETEEPGLSAREREVARLVIEGKTYREIGETIFVSPRTAEHHIARIRRRLGATSRSDLLVRLRRELDAPEPQDD